MTQPNPYPFGPSRLLHSVLGPHLNQYFLMASKYIRFFQGHLQRIQRPFQDVVFSLESSVRCTPRPSECQTNSPIRNKS
eukprot:g9294.t1